MKAHYILPQSYTPDLYDAKDDGAGKTDNTGSSLMKCIFRFWVHSTTNRTKNSVCFALSFNKGAVCWRAPPAGGFSTAKIGWGLQVELFTYLSTTLKRQNMTCRTLQHDARYHYYIINGEHTSSSPFNFGDQEWSHPVNDQIPPQVTTLPSAPAVLCLAECSLTNVRTLTLRSKIVNLENIIPGYLLSYFWGETYSHLPCSRVPHQPLLRG